MTDAEYNSKVAGLNDSQRDAFDRVVQYSRACHQLYMRETESLLEPFTCSLQVKLLLATLISVIKEQIESSTLDHKCLHACGTYRCCSIKHWWSHNPPCIRLPVEHGNLTKYT